MFSHAYLIGALVIAASSFFGGWQIHSWKTSDDEIKKAETFKQTIEATARELAKIEVKNVTIRQQIQGKIIERTYYRDCKHEPDVMLDINRALQNKPISSTELPRASAPNQ